MSTRFLTEDEILALLGSSGGGVDLASTTALRYLIGYSAVSGTDITSLNTNANCYMNGGYLYSGGQKVITVNDTSKLVNAVSRSTNGYISFGTILINWGQLTIAKNTSGSQYFPKYFAGTPYSAVTTWDYDYTGGQENYGITGLSSSQITIVNGEGTTRTFRWIAIGPA